MKRKKITKAAICLLLAGCTAGLLSGCSCSSSQEDYQETLAIANRYYNRLEYDKAEEYYLKSIDIAPAQQEPYVNLYQIYVETDRPQKAEQILAQAKENLSAEDFKQVDQKVKEVQKTAQVQNETSDEPQDDKSDETLLAAYQNALRTLLNEHRLPNGEPVEVYGDPLSPSQFAITDVNENGVPNLLIQYSGGSMASQCGYVGEFDSNTGAIQTLYFGGYYYEPYTPGILKTDASHNHTNVMEVWPFELYTWNQQANKYELYMTVSGYEPTPAEQSLMEYDQNGDGILYEAWAKTGDSGPSERWGYTDGDSPEEVVADLVDGASPMSVEFTDLTSANIDAVLSD